jgi:hypothetical protein
MRIDSKTEVHMLIRNRWFEIEVRSSMVYVRLGKLDACAARGQGLTVGRRASWLG